MPIPNGLSWSLKKIWQQRETLSSSGDLQQFVTAGRFKIKRMYNHLRQQGESDRLATKERLRRWNVIADSVCCLCHSTDESRDHLFFACSFVADIWNQVLQRSGIHRTVGAWNDEVQWVQKASRSTRSNARMCNSLFCETVYSIWLARNSKVFSNQLDSSLSIVNRILFRVACNS
ncbi:uncharacterized protein [Spinacia oleracea]|uniref:Reverse transcriptase zinc-binding domain-containing protein n=1 Tax=Spinacia oleracea TaxID=3562 RepID=A0ABM3QR87_SPIOL|nr:uncharacterized protein LOC130461717 [Spinacia oleracea]